MLCHLWLAGEEGESRTWSIGRFAPISTIYSLSELSITWRYFDWSGGLQCIDVVVECFLLRRKHVRFLDKLIWNAFFDGINWPQQAFSNNGNNRHFCLEIYSLNVLLALCLVFLLKSLPFVYVVEARHCLVLAFVSKRNKNICYNANTWWMNCLVGCFLCLAFISPFNSY